MLAKQLVEDKQGKTMTQLRPDALGLMPTVTDGVTSLCSHVTAGFGYAKPYRSDALQKWQQGFQDDMSYVLIQTVSKIATGIERIGSWLQHRIPL